MLFLLWRLRLPGGRLVLVNRLMLSGKPSFGLAAQRFGYPACILFVVSLLCLSRKIVKKYKQKKYLPCFLPENSLLFPRSFRKLDHFVNIHATQDYEY